MSPFDEVPGFADLPFPAKLTAKALVSGVWCYSFVEQAIDPATGALADLTASPREGAATGTSPAVELNNAEAAVPCYAWVRLRASVEGEPLFEFTAPPSVGGTVTGDVTYTGTMTYTGPVTFSNDTLTYATTTSVFTGPTSYSYGGTAVYDYHAGLTQTLWPSQTEVLRVTDGAGAFVNLLTITANAGGTAAAVAFTAAAPVSLPAGSTVSGYSSGTGTANEIPVWTSATTLAASLISQTVLGYVRFKSATGDFWEWRPGGTGMVLVNTAAGTTGVTYSFDDAARAFGVDDPTHASSYYLNGAVLAGPSGIGASWLPALNAITAPTGDVSLNGHKLTNVADPTAAQDGATKAYVDAAAAGLDWKASVRAATTAALPANTRTGNVLTASANGALPAQDGVTLALNDRLLVKNEASGANRGWYHVSAAGDGSSPWTLTRAADADTSAEVTSGAASFVSEGTVNGGTAWTLTTADPVTLNTTALTFTQFGGPGSYTAANGIQLIGTQFSPVYGTAAGTVCQGNDARLSDSRAPSGAAGGQLAGTYPNPTLNVHGLTLADPAPEDELPLYDVSGAANARASLTLALALNRGQPGLRLTLTAGVPVTTADVTGATAVKYSPYLHDMVCLWNGTAWGWYAIAEKSLALGTVTASLPYDVFMTYDSANFTLTKLAWSSTTARATALTYQDGRLCKSGDKASLYLGTFYATSTTATEDSATTRGLWNHYNRVQRWAKVASGSGHTYNSTTVRAWNNSTANRVSVLLGLAEEPLQVALACDVQNVAGETPDVGWGVDSTTAATIDLFQNSASVIRNRLGRSDSYLPTAGLHYYQALESLQAGTGNNSFNVFWLDVSFRG